MNNWALLISPDGTYSVWLKGTESNSNEDVSLCFTIDNEEAKRIINKTGCEVEEIPFLGGNLKLLRTS